MRSERYVVTELEGYMTTGADHRQEKGLSVMVLDTAYCYRVVKTWRSEDYNKAGGVGARTRIRIAAERTATALNEGRMIPYVSTYTKNGGIRTTERDTKRMRTMGEHRFFRPMCPRCEITCEPGSRYCVECGCRLYPASFYPERRR